MIIAGENINAGDAVIIKDGVALRSDSSEFILPLAVKHGWELWPCRTKSAYCFRRGHAEIMFWYKTRTVKIRQVVDFEIKFKFLKKVSFDQLEKIFESLR